MTEEKKKEENVHIKFLDPPASPPPNDGSFDVSPMQEENVHIKFLDPPASPPPNDVSFDVSPSGSSQLQTASVHPTSTASITLHPESSGPPQGIPIPVHISRSIPPELISDTSLDEELQHPDHPIEVDTKEEGEYTDEDDQDMPPLVDDSTDEAQAKEFSPDP